MLRIYCKELHICLVSRKPRKGQSWLKIFLFIVWFPEQRLKNKKSYSPCYLLHYVVNLYFQFHSLLSFFFFLFPSFFIISHRLSQGKRKNTWLFTKSKSAWQPLIRNSSCLVWSNKMCIIPRKLPANNGLPCNTHDIQ